MKLERTSWHTNCSFISGSPRGGGEGLALIFILAGGGGGHPSPLDPVPPSPGAPPPLPPQLKCTRKPGVWEHFSVMGKNFRRLRRMPYTVYILLHVCSIYLVFQTTMPQRSLSVYFSSPVPPLPRAKHEDVIDMLLYFRFKDRITGAKRQKAYNETQKARATLFSSVPMATLCEFVAVAQKMATRDRFRRV